MSTGKRLAKRSILGTKVMVPGADGLLRAGVIQAVKSAESSSSNFGTDLFSVRFEDSKRTFEFTEADIVGSGFRTVSQVQLQPGQIVYVTRNNREMSGSVVRHDVDDVLIRLNSEDETVLMKIDDVRLLESRKSARLVNSDTDFSKLADVATDANGKPKRSYNKASTSTSNSIAIDVPRSDYVQIAGSRKRRTSENLPDEFDVDEDSSNSETPFSECSAALLLMKLSCSPHSPQTRFNFSSSSAGTSVTSGVASISSKTSNDSFNVPPSPSATSFTGSGSSSFRSSTPSPPLSSSVNDEGIVKDLRTNKIIYQCTFPGCRETRETVPTIEGHVRAAHLQRPERVDDLEDEERDHEEEFYYTEIEVGPRGDIQPPHKHLAALSLADHWDMVRPPHMDPSVAKALAKTQGRKRTTSETVLSKSLPNSNVRVPITIAPSFTGSPGKMILISPPARSPTAAAVKPAAQRRPRDGKKCRKVYGLEQRDMWCTQCKWKKACARFGANATEPLPQIQQVQQQPAAGQQQQRQQLQMSPQQATTSLLIASTSVPARGSSQQGYSLSAAKALKF